MKNHNAKTQTTDNKSNANDACLSHDQHDDAWAADWQGLDNLEQRLLLSVSMNDAGWTDFGASSDTRVIYVSSSTGSDNNDGLTPETALKTVDKGKAMMRDNHPDWLLFKRGDSFGGLGSFTGFSGRSDQEMMLVSTYGEGDRPVFDSGVAHNITASGQDTTEHIAFVGLSLVATGRMQDTDSGASGVRFTGNVDNVLLEDLEVAGFKDGMVFQKLWDSITDISVRRSQVHHNFSSGGHSQGMFAKDVNGLFVEENLFDSNGWNEELGIEPTKFNHGLYIQHGTDGFELIGNIISRNSSHGVQARNGGVIENNLIVDNAVGAFIYSDSDESALQTVTNNVVIDASMRTLDDGKQRGWGYDLARTSNRTTVGGNLAVHSGDTSGAAVPKWFSGEIAAGFTIYDWAGNTDSPTTSNASDPNRNIETYHQELGRPGSLSSFIDQVIGQSKTNWSHAYTADAVNDYIRAGFGMNAEPGLEVLPPVENNPNPTAPAPTTPVTPPSNGGPIVLEPTTPINTPAIDPTTGFPVADGDGVIRFEAESAVLNGYITETKWGGSNAAMITNTSNTNQASASITFRGTPGTYTLNVGYYDENDGNATYSVSVDGVIVDTWTADQNLGVDAPHAQTAVERQINANVELTDGSVVMISSTRNAMEYARVDYVDFVPVENNSETPVENPTQNPSTPSNNWDNDTLTLTVDQLELSNYEIETRFTQSATMPNGTAHDVATLKYGKTTGTASYTFSGLEGQYDLTIGYYDENDGLSSYSVKINGQTIDTWTASANLGSDMPESSTYQRRANIEDLDLKPGDVITITGTGNQNEYARIGTLEITESAQAQPLPETQFSSDELYGDASDFGRLNDNRWDVVDDQDDRRLFLNSTDYQPLSGDRLGEHAIMDLETQDNFRLAVTARTNENLSSNVTADYAIVFGYQDDNNYSYMMLNAQQEYTQLFTVVDGQRQLLATATEAGITDNTYHDIVIERVNNNLTVAIDGHVILATDQAGSIQSGNVGLGSFNDSAYFDNLSVAQPITPVIDTDQLRIRLEAEDLNLDHYSQESQWDTLTGGSQIGLTGTQRSGSATFFANEKNIPSGTYDLVIGYYDENDGNSTFWVTVAGHETDKWNANDELGSSLASTDTLKVRRIFNVTINAEDHIGLHGIADFGENARYDYIELIEVPASRQQPLATSNQLNTQNDNNTPLVSPRYASIEAVVNGNQDQRDLANWLMQDEPISNASLAYSSSSTDYYKSLLNNDELSAVI